MNLTALLPFATLTTVLAIEVAVNKFRTRTR